MTLPDTSDRRIGMVLLLLAVMLLAWVLYDLWNRVYALGNARTAVAEETVVRAPPPRPKYQIGQIVNAHLFGKKAIKPVKQAPVEQKVVKTRLRLKLIGMIESTDPQYARALISLENGRPESYGIGDPIDRTDGKLHAVETNQVIIDRDGRLESLEMIRPSLSDEKGKGGKNNRNNRNSRNSNNRSAMLPGQVDQRVQRRYNNSVQRVQQAQRARPVQRTRRQPPPQPGMNPDLANPADLDEDLEQLQEGQPVPARRRRQPNPKFPF